MPAPAGLYKCPDGHWVGTKVVGKLVEGVLKVLELGVHILPLPPIDIDEADMSRFALESIRMETSYVTDKQPA